MLNKTEEKSKGEMANNELNHTGYIHDFATIEISELEKIYTIPVEMVAWIKQMLSM